ncbi:hypothetical protein D3H64_10090 [Atopobacter sp. AH10]|uniref:hypothetical protein n=1 Tax=Atopobacter sp. AH10 TaxID=2315861 RepID=UPI000EF217B4|nr:hypothetical protein [Atopobacter sp. AH10]RLK62390.1 hypothetical protein D3H64_10090 [Atopobacter sp. AH10]
MMIYHYTSMESLYLILKNRTLRFTNLLNMDDLEEGITQDYEYAKQYQYVSCWTEENQESIPQWSIYSVDMKGIRIGINIDEESIMDYFITSEDSVLKRECPSNLDFLRTAPYLSDNGCPFIRKMK